MIKTMILALTASLSCLGQQPKTNPHAAAATCPVRLADLGFYQSAHELSGVNATIFNASNRDIYAIAFRVSHTDRFGQAWTTYKTELTSEETIRPNHSHEARWDILIEEPTVSRARPDTTTLTVSRIVFADGHREATQGCVFTFGPSIPAITYRDLGIPQTNSGAYQDQQRENDAKPAAIPTRIPAPDPAHIDPCAPGECTIPEPEI